MGEVDPVHGRAVADVAVEEGDLLVGVGGGQPLHEVELGTDRPVRAGRRRLDGLDDELGRADEVGLEHHLVGALGVHQDLDVGVLGPELVDDVDREATVHGAVAAPQDDARVPQLLLGEPPAGQQRVPHDAVVEGEAHLEHRGVATEVLVGQEEHLRVLPLRERPPQSGLGVARGAHDAVVTAHEALDVGAGVHVGHRHDAVGDAGGRERVPGVLHLRQPGHVGHRAARGEVGEHDLLVVGGEDVGRLRHEVDAAEDDELRLGTRSGVARELEGVTRDVGELDHLVALVVVAQHEHAVAERLLGGPGTRHEGRVGRLRQVAGALHPPLGLQVPAAAEGEQGQVHGAHDPILGRSRQPAHSSVGWGRYGAGSFIRRRARNPRDQTSSLAATARSTAQSLAAET